MIQNIAAAWEPALPEDEYRYWYQFYFHGDRGQTGLTRHRRQLCKLLWTLWSPGWDFDDETFDRTAESFDKPDFVDVVIHSYRHRFGLVAGDNALADVESQLAQQPRITVPTITIDGDADGVVPAKDGSAFTPHVTSMYEHRRIPMAGHNLAQESPAALAEAVLCLRHDSG